jgi:uracil-DNA glycosylase
MTFKLEPSWQVALEDELKQPYIAELIDFLKNEYSGTLPIYPDKHLIFNALWHTPYDKVKVVIIGQDPYHGEGQAHGLCFSVQAGVPLPPSLQNIFKELESDLGIPRTADGCLTRWADQGVLLLNAVLTVQQGLPLSHRGRGWERFTDAVVLKLGQRKDPPLFVLWGSSAQQKVLKLRDCGLVTADHFLMAPHPSPLSSHRGFFGSKPFSQVNSLLVKQGKTAINW